jgi:endonuclease YncB( thermonuclease family)
VRRMLAAASALALATGCAGIGHGQAAGPAGKATSARVIRDVDGDTILASVGGRRRYVRLIGIDAPESVRPGTPVECGAKAAARSMAGLARAGAHVRLVADPTQDRVDRYGRLLRYVQRSGHDLGKTQIRRGWAEVYVYYASGPFERVRAYRRAERSARRPDRGAFKRCGGDFHKPRGARR